MRKRLTLIIASVLIAALAAVLIACGDGSSSSHNMDGMDHNFVTTAATAAEPEAIDRAFVSQMIPHHEMAVEMAEDAQEMSEHSEIKTTADAIISGQTKEITQLRAIAERLDVEPASMGGSHQTMMKDAQTLGLSVNDMGMHMDMDSLEDAKPFDKAFIDAMIPHHQGAIRMANAQLKGGSDSELNKIATAIVAAQTKEIKQMNSWRKDWYGKSSPAGGVPTS